MDFGKILEEKLANALFPDAEAIDSVPDVTTGALRYLKKKQGGLWVGGAAMLTDRMVYFAANSLNAGLHKGETSFAVLLPDISAVDVEFGWVTKIIAITTHDGETRRIRCFGAKEFADRIRKQVGLR